ncbi:hypothetical protein Tco_1377520 [Tanacetum coccineum]
MSSSKWEAKETSRSLLAICSIALRPTLHSTFLTLWKIEWQVAKNEHPNSNNFIKCKSVDPIFSSFNMSNLNIMVEHGLSSSQAQQTTPEEQIETKINSWFEQTTWNGAEREISLDKVLGKDEEERLSFGERMAYKSCLSTKRQHRESRTKMGVLKNFMKRWAKLMSYKDI